MLNMSFVSKTGDPFGEIIKEINADEQKTKEQINALGQETALEMKKIINDNKVRPQAGEATVLENIIDVEYFENGWGVGNLDLLQSHAPWWSALNWGSSHMIGKHLPPGTFQPGVPKPTNEDFRSGRWKKGTLGSIGGKLYSPIVKKAIEATNYIEKTIFWLSSKFDALKG